MLRLQLHQALKLQQSLKLTPQLQLAMKMLQLNQLELAELIKQEVEKNPLLEIVEKNSDPETLVKRALENPNSLERKSEQAAAEKAANDGGETKNEQEYDEDYFKYLLDSQDNHYTGGSSAVAFGDPDKESNLEEYVAGEISLTDHLFKQLHERDYGEAVEKIIEYLIASLDPAGYLRYDEDQILEVLGVDVEELDKAIGKLQNFDPPGTGARNLSECLLLQYESLRDMDPFVMTVIRNYLEELASNKIKQIASREGVDLQTVLDAREEIRSLDPKPGLHFGSGMVRSDRNRYVKPDVLVEWDPTREDPEERLTVEILAGEVPTLRINRFYEQMLRSEKVAPKKTMSYIRQKLQSARFVKESIERRRDTIRRVTRRIFEIQEGFFERGVKGLKPLVLREVAEHCELHESTVSRVTNSKYVQTPRGLFPLKFFFSSGTKTSSGEDISSLHIKKLIKEQVAKENTKKPLSDSKLQKILEEQGVKIARRTVAKYREELGILSSSKRKQFV
jgi:RNA polymerase sigma-54 factor